MPGISIHVVDVARGVPAEGMRVELFVLDPGPTRIADTHVGASGAVDVGAIERTRLAPGRYEARFHAAEFFRAAGVPLPARPFVDVVAFEFGVDDADQHYHLPLKITPWGLSLFRGGR